MIDTLVFKGASFIPALISSLCSVYFSKSFIEEGFLKWDIAIINPEYILFSFGVLFLLTFTFYQWIVGIRMYKNLTNKGSS